MFLHLVEAGFDATYPGPISCRGIDLAKLEAGFHKDIRGRRLSPVASLGLCMMTAGDGMDFMDAMDPLRIRSCPLRP